MKLLQTLFVLLLFCVQVSLAQSQASDDSKKEILNTYVIEREIPEVGNLSYAQLEEISQTSCSVLKKMDAESIQWIHSYVAEDKIYCIYKATNEELLKEHAAQGGFPINSISMVSEVISPETAGN